MPAMLLAFGTGIALPAIPILAKSFEVTFGQASFVLTAFVIGGTVGTLPTGWLIDRVGRRPVLIAGPLITAAMAFMVMVAQSFPELLFYRFMAGWAGQMWLLARLARISHEAGAGQRGRQVSWMYGMDNVGRLAGPLVGGLIAAALGPRSPFAAYGVLALLALVPTIKLASEIPSRRTPGGERSQVSRPMSIPEIVLPRLPYFGISFFSAMARGPVFAGMLFLYAAFAYNLDASSIGVLATTASLMGLPIGFTAGWLMDRFGRKVTMVPGFTSVTIGMLLIGVTAFLQLPLQFYVGAFLFAVASQSLTGGSIQTVGADVAPPQARGMFLGLWRFTAQVGSAFSPVAFAFFADHAGYGFAFVFVAAAALMTALLLIFSVPETARSSAPVPVTA
jgi:MFS family permease